MFNKILLAVDGSDHARHAAHKAADLARALKPTELRIVAAYSPIPTYLGEPNLQIMLDSFRREAQRIMDKSLIEVGEVPCEVHTEILEGDAAEAILNVANTRKSDLIVMGSRGHGGLTGLLVGSTSQKVVAHANCPVLIVR
jgi:nucleotide-binding universal stress UspA family protein